MENIKEKCSECDSQSSYYCNKCKLHLCNDHNSDHLEQQRSWCIVCCKEVCNYDMKYGVNNDDINYTENLCFYCWVGRSNDYIQKTSSRILSTTMDIDGDDTIHIAEFAQRISNLIKDRVMK